MYRRFQSTVPVVLCTLAIVVTIGDLAQAQQRRRSGRFFGDTYSVGMSLLQEPKVQAELNLSDEQSQKASEMNEKFAQDRREIYEGVSREQWRERGEELRGKTRELAKTAAMAYADTLDEAQKKRWLGITLQVRGPAALPGEYLAEQLNLDQQQVQKLNELTSQQREKMFELFRQSRDQGLSREERTEKFSALVAETNEQRLAVLNDEQKAAFEAMQGEKLELPEN